MEKESQLRDYLIEKIEKEIPYCRLNGDRERRLPNNVNFSFQYIEGESLLIMLDMKGICASKRRSGLCDDLFERDSSSTKKHVSSL